MENIEPQSILKTKKKRIRNRKPTVRQIKALQLINQGKSVRGALKEAGYSPATYNKSTEFYKQKGVKVALLSMMGYLEGVGLTNEKLASKIAEFVDAQKVHSSITEPDRIVPDYKTQVEGVKLWTELVDKTQKESGPKKKRELTITEFITGEEEK